MTSDPLLRDLLHFRCSDPACEATTRVRLEMWVPRGTLPTPGPCPACKAPMALGGRVQMQSAELRAIEDHEASG